MAKEKGQMDKQRSIKHKTENWDRATQPPLKTGGWTKVLWKGEQFLLHIRLKNYDVYFYGCRHFEELFGLEKHKNCIILLPNVCSGCIAPMPNNIR